jgi:hypothetical protein
MKLLYATGSLISFVIILVLAFENIQASCNYLTFFFWELSSAVAPTFVLFGTAVMGMITGAFMTLLATSVLSSNDYDEEADDFEA